MKTILNKPILTVAVLSVLLVMTVSAQSLQGEVVSPQNNSLYYSPNQNYGWNWNNWGNQNQNNNLSTQVYSFIQSRWGQYLSNQQKIQQLQKVVDFLNLKIAGLQQGGGSGGGGGGQGNGNFYAEPVQGQAPLSVTFFSKYSGQGGIPTLDFGDGKYEQISSCNAPADYCIAAGKNFHTYKFPGVYTARVVQSFCPPGAQCFAAEKVLATLKIRVY